MSALPRTSLASAIEMIKANPGKTFTLTIHHAPIHGETVQQWRGCKAEVTPGGEMVVVKNASKYPVTIEKKAVTWGAWQKCRSASLVLDV